MKSTRDFSFAAKLASVAGMVAFGVLVLGGQASQAAPNPPVGPTDIQPPVLTIPPKPPTPKPCQVIKCTPPTLEPCFVTPGHTCTPPTLDPCVVKPADCTPTKPPTPDKPPTLTPRPSTPTTTTTTHGDTPTGSIPTPNRIDTGEGPATEGGRDWLFWLAPGFGVFALSAAAFGLWWLRRSEGNHR